MTIRARILLIVLTLMFIAVGGYYMLIGVMDTSSLGLVQNLSASWMALSMFMLAVVLYRVLGSRVIARLSELNKQAHQLKISVHTDEHIRVSGNDEIADLASTLNETFERLASARYALKDAADEWLTTFNAISDPIAIQDADFRILRVNDAYLRLVNKPADEVIGQLCFHIIHQCDAPVAACPHARTLQSGQLEYNITYEAALGRHFEALTFPIFDDQHRVKATVHMLKDISARRAAEEEQKQLRDKAEIHSRLAAVGEMAAGIAHEINNPLTGVIGFSDLLMNRPDLPGIIREELKIINDGSLRVKDIVQRMLAFSQQLKPMQSLVNITELIENTLELRAYALKTANIKVVREYAPELPWITVDPGQIQQVFLNLIVNAEFAMKKAHDRGILTITTGQTEEHIRILVSDTGPGLTDEAKAKLFQPFFTTKNPGEGAGLGLPLSRGIIHEHGGTIKIDELAGDGTTFIIELPLSRDDTAAAPRQAAGGRPAEPLENARVLVVDDEQMVRSFIKQILTESGHIVEECDNGFQALEKLEEFAAYDVILMDVRMPGLSGIELHYEIANRWPDLAARITFITGDISDSATRDYLANHKLAFITKPFTRASLADKLSMKTTSEASE